MRFLPFFLLLTGCTSPEGRQAAGDVVKTVVDTADAAARGDLVTAAITLVTGLSGAGFLYWRRKKAKKKAAAKAAEAHPV